MYNTFFNVIIKMVMIMFNYESLVNKMRKISNSKSDEVVYCNNNTGNLKMAGIVIAITYLASLLLKNRAMFIFIFICLIIFIYVYVAVKKGSILLDDDKVWIVLFKPFGIAEKNVYELDQKRIRFFDVKNGLLFRRVKVSFISDDGRLVKLNLQFAKVMYSPGSGNYKEISNKVYNKLTQIQKVIDKGDF